MSLATYSDLETAVANWLARDDLTSYIPDLITVAEKRIFDELKVREMETSFSGTIASGTVAVPSDFISWKAVYIDQSPIVVLTPMSLAELLSVYPTRSSDGLPSAIAVNGSNFEFGRYPDSTYTVKGTYYQQPATLVGGTTNVIFPTYSDLYLWATLAEAAPFMREDPRIALWESKYQTARDRANLRNKRGRYEGSIMQPRAI